MPTTAHKAIAIHIYSPINIEKITLACPEKEPLVFLAC
jgi:hypothetical protein